MKDGWEIKKLGEVCDFQNGFAFKSNLFKDNGLPVLRISNIQDNRVDTKNVVYFSVDDYRENLDKYRILKDDLLIAMSGGTTGKIGFNTSNRLFYLNQRVGKFEPKKSLLKKYLFYLLSTKVEENLRISLGSAQPNLSTEQIKNLEIPLPPIDEQRRIVAILDEAFAGIAAAKENAEQNLKNAKEVFEALLQDTFLNHSDDWEEKQIKNIGVTQTGITPHTSDKENYGDYIPFVKPADIDIDGFGTVNYINFGLSRKGLSSGRLIKKNSILMVCIGASIGKTGFSEREVSCNQQINSLTVNNDLEPKFFYYALKRRSFFDKVILNSAQATLPIINKSKWENISVKYPKSIDEQRRIVSQFDSITAETSVLESIYQQKLSNLQELKKSLLQQAFSGAL